MRRAIMWGIPIIVILVIVILYGLIAFLIAQGVASAERKPQEDHPSAHGLQFEDVEFVSRRGDVTLSGWYINPDSGKPTLIFVHGMGSRRSGDRAVELAARLVGRGFSVLLFDLRGHGSSGGDKASGGYYERWDLLGAFDFLVGRGVPRERIGVVGFSMGAGTALLAAAEEPAIRALVADSPFANASDRIADEAARKTIFPRWIMPIFLPTARLMASQIYGIDIGAVVPEDAAKRLSYPILVIHGMADTRIPFEQAVRVHKAAHPQSDIWLVPEVDHVDAFLTHPEEYVERMASYFEGRLGVQ